MGFNNITLLVFPLGLLLPLATVAYMVYASTKKKIAFDTVFYGIGAFLESPSLRYKKLLLSDRAEW